METTNDIVREIRAQQNGNVHTISAKEAYALADRIEAAHKREQEDAIAATVVAAAKSASEVYEPHIQSEPVGNAAKMREALMKIQLVCWKAGGTMRYSVACGIIKAKSRAALSAPPRNCDKYSHDEALRIWSSLPESKENGCFDVWLYAEAKGDAK